jgi:AraC-like DNA-binding protein
MLRSVRLRPGRSWSEAGSGLRFVFVKVGIGECRSGEAAQPLRPGDILVVQAGNGSLILSQGEGDLEFSSFSVCLEHLFPLFFAEELFLVQDLVSAFKSPRCFSPSHPATAPWHKLVRDVPSEFNLEHRGQLLKIAAAILDEEFKKARPSSVQLVRSEDRMAAAFEQVSVQEILTSSVDDLAKRFRCSRRHLNRLFHHQFGLSVGALRMEMRLLKAVSLLRNANFKIIRVAEQCGFNHLGLFNTCFKRRFGMSPGQWRKKPAERSGGAAAPAAEDPACRLRINGLCPWSDGRSGQSVMVGRRMEPSDWQRHPEPRAIGPVA